MKEFFSAFVKLVIYICISGSVSNIVGYLIRRDKINTYSFLYSPFRWEDNGEIYRKIKINLWKNKVPDMSKYLKMLYPKKMSLHPGSEQILRLVQESCVAECIHIMLIAASPLVYYYINGKWGMFFTVAYALGNLPFIIIQRYNRPKLKALYNQLHQKECLKSAPEESANENSDVVVQYRSGS